MIVEALRISQKVNALNWGNAGVKKSRSSVTLRGEYGIVVFILGFAEFGLCWIAEC